MRYAPLRLPALFVCLTVLAGCGTGGIPPNGDGSFNIVDSSAIQTGNWIIEQPLNSNGTFDFLPIVAFAGGITADGKRIQGQFTTGSSDPGAPGLVSHCLRDPISTVWLTGEVEGSALTMDGSFEANSVHLEGQLSADRKKIVSGRYSVSGACATRTAPLTGRWIPPLTGTFVGTSVSVSGVPVQITVTVTQQNRYFGSGYIPVEGTEIIASANCTVKAPMFGAFLLGPYSELIGFTNWDYGDNVRLYGTEDEQSARIELESWEYYQDPVCGSDYAIGSLGSPIVLTKQ